MSQRRKYNCWPLGLALLAGSCPAFGSVETPLKTDRGFVDRIGVNFALKKLQYSRDIDGKSVFERFAKYLLLESGIRHTRGEIADLVSIQFNTPITKLKEYRFNENFAIESQPRTAKDAQVQIFVPGEIILPSFKQKELTPL